MNIKSSIIFECDTDSFLKKNEELWENSPFEQFHTHNNSKQRGKWGELLCERVMRDVGSIVRKSDDTDYDRLIDGHKIEIKTNCSDFDDEKTHVNFDQIRPAQDYEYVLCQVVCPRRIRIFLIPHADIPSIIERGLIKNQHGGTKAHSGTYMLSGRIPDWLLDYETDYPAIHDILTKG